MADFDVVADTTPALPYNHRYGRPTIDELVTELQAIDGTTYTNAAVLKMTRNDLVYAIRALS
jgi:hypothetical protein